MNWFSSFLSRGTASGRWSGHYEQHGKSFPIEASLKHRGGKLFGTMTDSNGQHSQSLRSMLEESKLSDQEIEQFISEVRSNFPRSPDGEIEYRSYLPARSLIEGEIEDCRIAFTKRYEGYHEIEYVLNDLALPDSVHCEIVQYVGAISPDSETISGEWSISPVDEPEAMVAGAFRLNRQRAG